MKVGGWKEKGEGSPASQCKMQTADYCFYHVNKNVTTIVPFFSKAKNNCPQSAFYTAPTPAPFKCYSHTPDLVPALQAMM